MQKSKDFQHDCQMVRMVQNHIDSDNASMTKIGKFATQFTSELKKLPTPYMEKLVEKHGLQAIQQTIDQEALGERRPKWIIK